MILAFRFTRVLTEIHIAIEALSTSLESVASSRDIYIFTGLDERIKTANRIANSWVRAGIYCLVASTVLAAWSIYAAQPGPEFPAIGHLVQFSGLYGILLGTGLFSVTWLLVWLALKGTEFVFDAKDEKGSFEPLLSNYLDIAKFVLGLASGSIVLLVGTATFRPAGHLLASFAAPLFLLALSILFGLLFMASTTLNYEAYRHKTKPYTRFKYARNLALGFSCLSCFGVGYVWLIVIVTGQ